MSEKITEIYLTEILKIFPNKNIYYNPNNNTNLKNIFSEASKTE